MSEKKDVEIRVFGSRKEYASLDARDESQVAEIIRTQVLPKTKAEYYHVDVKIKRDRDQVPKYFIAYLLRKDIYLAEVVKVDIESNYQVTSTTWDYDESNEEEEEDFSFREVEDAYINFVVATPVDYIHSAKEAVEKLHNLFTSFGFKSKMLLGTEATVANYKQYLTRGLKGFVNIGHGNTNLIVLADGTLGATWFNSVTNVALEPAVIYFNSCKVHNDPLKSSVIKAGTGTRTFIGGIVNLLIGPSEEVCKCFWGQALKTGTFMGDVLHTCENEKYPNEGAHGITGDTGSFFDWWKDYLTSYFYYNLRIGTPDPNFDYKADLSWWKDRLVNYFYEDMRIN